MTVSHVSPAIRALLDAEGWRGVQGTDRAWVGVWALGRCAINVPATLPRAGGGGGAGGWEGAGLVTQPPLL